VATGIGPTHPPLSAKPRRIGAIDGGPRLGWSGPPESQADKSADGTRKRRATANRILTVLKAALNHAWKSGHVASDDAWRRVKPFRAVERARVRYLSEAECVRLVNACEPAFRNLVRGAMLTGCRYSELTTMHVADFNADAGVVTVRESKAGKPRHVVLTAEGQKLFATLTAGKLGSDPWRSKVRSSARILGNPLGFDSRVRLIERDYPLAARLVANGHHPMRRIKRPRALAQSRKCAAIFRDRGQDPDYVASCGQFI
jgi:integrase